MSFNEDSRVKIPALLHLARLDYEYIPRNQHSNRIEKNNIFSIIFKEGIKNINPNISDDEVNKLLEEISASLEFDDLGRDFYQCLTSSSGIKLIDFENFEKNLFHFTTELVYKSGEEEFRPDITILINGMPLAFVEVKKPNNREGIIAERNRMNRRFRAKHFKTFANITQLMIFSNNMEYEDGVTEPIMGVFYSTSAYGNLHFNYFREEEILDLTHILKPENEEFENFLLKDNNIAEIKYSPEFIKNKDYNSPTHRVLTSLFHKKRLAFLLKYGIAYVREENKDTAQQEWQKHIMRYPQIFATFAIEKKLNEGINKGIIWHTQGSGKTALAYYNVQFLTDYFQKKGVIPKFYFVVDRLDLANQAQSEFAKRGLEVKRVNSRQDFVENMKSTSVVMGSSGGAEISVVNIQKFSEDSVSEEKADYDVNIQRIYFVDEAHRSFNPKGDYFLNLLKSDKNAIKIALTGTPLLKEVAKNYDSKTLFGDYIHKYYYNKSIADGYTLRLIREEINTEYKMKMQEVMEQISVKAGEISKSKIFAHQKFTAPMLDYIVNDLTEFRQRNADESLGAMVVCDTSEQAKELYKQFKEKYAKENSEQEDSKLYGKARFIPTKASLILHDVNDKVTRKSEIEDFKIGKIDVLFVYNMLLTGFDAKRLKKLYLARVVKDHNLLQTLTRVNRPYKNYRYGFVVDFADISAQFEKANYNYLEELKAELGDEMEHYSNLFKTRAEIENEIAEIKETLFHYDTKNRENFSNQITEINDKKRLLELLKQLINAKELRNIIRLQGEDDLLKKADFSLWHDFLKIVSARMEMLKYIESINEGETISNLLNVALEDIYFQFVKISESELKIADELQQKLRRTREEMQLNFDPKDPQFVSLREELERIFRSKNLNETTQEGIQEHIRILDKIYDEVREINRKNALLKEKYKNDERYVRVHKELKNNQFKDKKESQIYEALLATKEDVDDIVLRNSQIIKNEGFFAQDIMQKIIFHFMDTYRLIKEEDEKAYEGVQNISNLIISEYKQEWQSWR